MPSQSNFQELKQTGVDADDDTIVSAGFDIANNSFVAFGVEAESGAHDVHVVILDYSFDNATWKPSGKEITGVGFQNNIQATMRYVRLRLKTKEGGPSVITWYLQAK